MNNDLEFNSQNVKNVEDNLKNIFLKLILNDIPENKRNAIKLAAFHLVHKKTISLSANPCADAKI